MIYLKANSLARDNVVIAQRFDDGIRFTCYDSFGPAWDHFSPTLKNAMRTVKSYKMSLRPDGAETLDSWQGTDDWRLGLAQAIFTQTWNVCAASERYDIANWLDDYAHKYGVENAANIGQVIVKNLLGKSIW